MQLFSRARHTSFCAFCKSPRRLYRRKHVGPTNVVSAIVIAAGLSMALWNEPDPRGLLFFSTYVIVAEVFIYLRWRAALTCRMCGFDPLVYKRSPAAASLAVREFFDRMGEDPQLMMSKSPLVEVHRRRREAERKRREIDGVRERALKTSAGRPPGVVVGSKPNEKAGHHSDVQRA